jgi:hypothetical protein
MNLWQKKTMIINSLPITYHIKAEEKRDPITFNSATSPQCSEKPCTTG